MTNQNHNKDFSINSKVGSVVQFVGKRKKWVVVQIGMVDRAFKDRHFEITLADFKEVEASLPNPNTVVVSIRGIGRIFERNLTNPHDFKDFTFVEKRKIKKSIVKFETYSPEIRNTISGESNLYKFV